MLDGQSLSAQLLGMPLRYVMGPFRWWPRLDEQMLRLGHDAAQILCPHVAPIAQIADNNGCLVESLLDRWRNRRGATGYIQTRELPQFDVHRHHMVEQGRSQFGLRPCRDGDGQAS